jgi:hypothetical protein
LIKKYQILTKVIPQQSQTDKRSARGLSITGDAECCIRVLVSRSFDPHCGAAGGAAIGFHLDEAAS